ncbi:Hypothetical_protein [Hexamita inflata]|uniref:Hypothetical_protein n=1 Tax=Hexamita inflata TaxID=28002 RepID=A0AA86Q5Q0_9EUKA|nr:Hypothetical protein HINF_LOCUS39328 [Hexamita inflata]
MKFNQETTVLNVISKLTCVKSNDPLVIVYQVMMLPNNQYNFLFYKLALELNLQISTIHKLFIQLSQRYLIVHDQTLSTLNHTLQASQQFQKSKEAENIQKTKIPASQFKLEFSQTLRKLINDVKIEQRTDKMTDKQLCQYLTQYFTAHNQKIFWERVNTAIPYKTSLQLKQYFQKSFTKCIYEDINNCVKYSIKELTLAMPQSKPSEIVDIFFTNNENIVYFRREVLMLVQYFQRTE